MLMQRSVPASVLLVIILLCTVWYQASPTRDINLLPQSSESHATPKKEIDNPARNQLPLYFIENQGQIDLKVSHYLIGRNQSVYFTAEAISYVFTYHENNIAPRWNLKLEFEHANRVTPSGIQISSTTINYFRQHKNEWKTAIPTYGGLRYNNLWSGIDLEFRDVDQTLKYYLMVKPNADPNAIQFSYRGTGDAKISEAGALIISTPLGTYSDSAPIAWQTINGKRYDIPVRFKLATSNDKATVQFELGEYDPQNLLIIDPTVLVYSGFFGGSGQEGGISGPQHDLAVDQDGNAYIVGTTASDHTSFPVTIGPDLTYNGSGDVFVAKINSAGNALIYAGYIGGASGNQGYAIDVDDAGAAYITGFTNGGFGFPQVVGPDLSYAGVGDAFVIKIDPSGTTLEYAGYIGGSGQELGYDIAVDSSGAAYVTGYTSSTETSLPVINGPDLSYNGGSFDVFIAKVKPDGTGFDYLGYLGGDNEDIGYAIAVDNNGFAYVAGSTSSNESTFPITVGSADSIFNGGTSDGFFAKVNNTGSELVFASYLGGNAVDKINDLAIDSSNVIYLVGETASDENSFPVTSGSFDTTYNGGSSDVFFASINSDGSQINFASYLGGAGTDIGHGIALNSNNDIFLTGQVLSDESTFPVFDGPDLTINGATDAFFAHFNSTGDQRYSIGYIGGNSADIGYAIAISNDDDAIVMGRSCSTESSFPVLTGPFLTNQGGCDEFISKIKYTVLTLPDIDVSPTNIDFGSVNIGTSNVQTIMVSNLGNADLQLATLISPTIPFTIAGGSCSSNLSLQSGENCSLDIQFTPLTPGLLTEQIFIPSNDPDVGNGNGQNNTQVTLSGNGTTTATANIDVSSLSVNFSNTLIGSQSLHAISISNTGNAPLNLNSFTTVSPPFSISGGSCNQNSMLLATEICSMEIQFAPTSTGFNTTNFSILSNDPDSGTGNGQNNVQISLSGNGIVMPNPNIDVSPLNMDFGFVLTGEESSMSVLIRNTGNTPLTLYSFSGLTAPYTVSGGNCIENLNIAVDNSCTMEILFTPVSDAITSAHLIITSDDPDIGTANGQQNVQIEITGRGQIAEADLATQVSPANSIGQAGLPTSYTYTINNTGPDTAHNVVISETLDSNLSLISLQPSQGSCSDTTNFKCELGNIAAGSSATLSITVTPTDSGKIDHNATIESDTLDPDESNNPINKSVDSGTGADLSLAISSMPFPAVSGSSLTYSITVTNNGPLVASDVVLNTSLPDNVALNSFSSSIGSCFEQASSILCTLNKLENDVLQPGASATLTLSVTPMEPKMLHLLASVSATEFDPDILNNNSDSKLTATPPRIASSRLDFAILNCFLLIILARRILQKSHYPRW